MEVFECIKTRRSVRSYEKKDVPNELIGQIIFAGIQAPSAGNMQPWEFIVVKDEKTKKELSFAALRQNHVEEAPVVIVVCANPEKSGDRYGDRGRNLYCIQDTAAAIENMLLTANSLGLGTCWIGAFDEGKIKTILNIPERIKAVAIITLGFPVPYKKPGKKSRIPFENITWIGQYGEDFSWIEKYGEEWKYKIRPLEEHAEKLKEKLALRKK
jgi:nitroreductase